jgi:anti-anti-sigma factor
MNLEVIEKDSGAILRISGHVGSEETQRLEDECKRLIDSDNQRVVIDLQNTDFLGSAAICQLVIIGKKLKAQNRPFMICPNASTRKVLEMGGINQMFPLVKNPEKALSEG